MATTKPKTRDCPVCGRGFLKGSKCLVAMSDGRLVRKRVCNGCSSKAERIVTRGVTNQCMVPACENASHICTHHHASDIVHTRDNALAECVKRVLSMIAAIKLTEHPEEQADFVAGRTDGLETALEVLRPRGVKRRCRRFC